MKKSLHTILLSGLILLISGLLIASFADSPADAGGEKQETNAPAIISLGGKGTITCSLDGRQRTFAVQQSFFEISLDPDAKGTKDGIEILDGSPKKEGFQFEFKKSGITKITDRATGDLYCIINYYNPDGIVYTGKDIVINVISYDKQKLNGSFSGTLVNAHYGAVADKYPELIKVTDGKFNLEN
ncbi:MAG TPA: hypothetical protein VG890_10830 [Puia sp.]|nr:hypothetical protein [Puia sp.]